jgi:hypothetical protein
MLDECCPPEMAVVGVWMGTLLHQVRGRMNIYAVLLIQNIYVEVRMASSQSIKADRFIHHTTFHRRRDDFFIPIPKPCLTSFHMSFYLSCFTI